MGKEVVKIIPRIVQITGEMPNIHALDEYGDVWRYYDFDKEWKRIPGLPETTKPNKDRFDNHNQ